MPEVQDSDEVQELMVEGFRWSIGPLAPTCVGRVVWAAVCVLFGFSCWEGACSAFGAGGETPQIL